MNARVTLVELDEGIQWLLLQVGGEAVYFVDPRHKDEFDKTIGPFLL